MNPLLLSIILSLPPAAISFQAAQLRINSLALASQGVTYRTYQNARYNYSIAYPSTLRPQGEADNGDGQAFLSQDEAVEMRVWGSNNIFDLTLRKAYETAITEMESSGGATKYKFLGRDFFAVSGTRGEKVFYQKTLFRGDVLKTFRIDYPVALQSTYDSITARIARSFKG